MVVTLSVVSQIAQGVFELDVNYRKGTGRKKAGNSPPPQRKQILYADTD